MVAGDYAVITEIEGLLDIPTASTKYDTLLLDLKEDADRDVDDVLYIHAATLPLTGDEKTSAEQMANYHVCYKFKIRQNASPDAVKLWKDEYKDAKDKLIAKLKAQPSTNTQSQSIIYSQDYRSDPIATREG